MSVAAGPDHGEVKALLFDLDGTLIDSMPLHHEAWRTWFGRHGLPFDEDGFFAATAGRTNDEILRDMFPEADERRRQDMAEEKEALYRAAAAERLALIGGTEALLAQARAAGLRLAICTASPPGNMAVAFARFGLDRAVDTVVSPADGLRGKPHPDIFLEAARRLDVPPAQCVVFEDAPLGVESARRAGMPAVALTTTLSASEFEAFDNVLAARPDLHGIDPTRLNAAHLRPKENHHA